MVASLARARRWLGAAAAKLRLAVATATLVAAASSHAADVPPRPNLIVILADDLGWGELGVYGQRRIRTPNLDRMAADGVRFTDFYAGAPVCAPTRSVLMTGQHGGRTRVRGNAGPSLQRLDAADVTVAEVLRQAGYRTALVGKWGLGQHDDEGQPNRQGFDFFFGYLDQVHAHNHYPEFLWRNDAKVPLPNVVEGSRTGPGGFTVGWTREPRVYAEDLLLDEALRWIRAERDRPFLLVFAPTLPHADNQRQYHTGNGQEAPTLGAYADAPWPAPERGHAAAVARLDADVGRVLDELRRLGIAERTLVLFTSDNGPHREGGYEPEVFAATGPFRGVKRSLGEGGIRVPAIAWWPGTTPAGVVSSRPAYVGDVMATAAALAGTSLPAPANGLWSVSLVPTLTGHPERQTSEPYLYWERYEPALGQAVRFGQWKAVRDGIGGGALALYDLERDPGEGADVAVAHPDVVARATEFMDQAHVPAPAWTAHATRYARREEHRYPRRAERARLPRGLQQEAASRAGLLRRHRRSRGRHRRRAGRRQAAGRGPRPRHRLRHHPGRGHRRAARRSRRRHLRDRRAARRGARRDLHALRAGRLAAPQQLSAARRVSRRPGRGTPSS